MDNKEQKAEHTHSNKNWYDKSYKIFLFVPVAILIISLIYLFVFYSQHGDLINRDVTLKGGTTITILGEIDSVNLEVQLKERVPDVLFRSLSDLRSGKQIALVIESSMEPEELKQEIEGILEYELNDENSSIEFTGPSLSKNFYRQLIIALIISFILMSLVVAIMFRTFIPSIAVIFAALSDIIMTLALVNYLGIKISAAGIAAFLMLIGYSVDTDILLTTRALKKKEGTLNQRIYGAFKTGTFMTTTALVAVLPAFFIVTGLPDSFKQIFLILAIGLFADIMNTWMTNASIIKWYCEKKGIK